jgi:hypothetical protein
MIPLLIPPPPPNGNNNSSAKRCVCYIFVSDVFFLMRSEILSVSLKMKNFEKNLKKGDQKRQKTQGRKRGG